MTFFSRLRVNHNQVHAYDIVTYDTMTALQEELETIGCKDKKVCIITDSNVAKLYLDEVTQVIKKNACHVCMHTFDAGEENKTLSTVRDIYHTLIENQLDRKDFIIALGGGVVGDVAGFVAASYLRGIRFIQMPTTLLSQVDSSIGGKTGVDFSSYKNMVGAFHMPSLVYVNIHTLHTLSNREFSSGMGEVIKHGLIKDKSYYEWLMLHKDAIVKRDDVICADMVLISQKIKKMVVEEDPFEEGLRGILNLGHTLGHAIEKELHFSLTHGECVGLGMLCSLYISHKRGFLTNQDIAYLKEVLSSFGLLTHTKLENPESIILATKNDKKMEDGQVKFILLKSIGEAFIEKSVTVDEMREALGIIYA